MTPDYTIFWSGTKERAGECPSLTFPRPQHPAWYAPPTRSDGGLVDRRHYRARTASLTAAQAEIVAQARVPDRVLHPWRFRGTHARKKTAARSAVVALGWDT